MDPRTFQRGNSTPGGISQTGQPDGHYERLDGALRSGIFFAQRPDAPTPGRHLSPTAAERRPMTDYINSKKTERHSAWPWLHQQELANMTTTTSRRAILAGAACIPALAVLPATAIAPAAAADPIFAAIERHREAEAAFAGAYDNAAYRNATRSTPATDAIEERADELGGAANNLYVDLVTMTPTTPAGCAALLRHIEAHERANGVNAILDNHERAGLAARDLLSRLAAMLDTHARAA
jgi:hypothetical protein